MDIRSLIIDAIVIITYFVVIVGIGLSAGRRNKSLRDYAVGGRSIPWWAVFASIIAAETSAATFLGTPAEGFKTRSFSYAQLAIGTVLARVVIAYLFIAPYFKYRVQSIYEFLDLRFGPMTKNASSAIFLVTRVLGIGVRLYLGGVIMVVVWRYLLPDQPIGLHTYFWGILFVTVVTTFYTAVGGIKAVVWTDLIQACLMMGAVIFAIITLYLHIPGGWATIDAAMKANPGVGMFQTGWDTNLSWGEAFKAMLEKPYTLLAAFLGSTFFTMATHGTDQDMVQRLLTAENPKKSKFSLILSGLADIPIVLAFLAVGMLLYVYYQGVPKPQVPDNEIFAHYIVNEMPVVVRGLIIAGVFATMMGSTSAALNALATSFVRDFYQPYLKKEGEPEARSILVARIATGVFGGLMVIVATLSAYAVLKTNVTIIPLALGILGYSYGAILGMFLLGVLTKRRGHDVGNIIGMVCGIAAVLILCKIKVPFIDIPGYFLGKGLAPTNLEFGWFMPPWWPAISWPYYVLIGSVVSFAVALCFPSTKELPEYVEHEPEPEPEPGEKRGFFH
jgi:SSS family solute:Na+ symporter